MKFEYRQNNKKKKDASGMQVGQIIKLKLLTKNVKKKLKEKEKKTHRRARIQLLGQFMVLFDISKTPLRIEKEVRNGLIKKTEYGPDLRLPVKLFDKEILLQGVFKQDNVFFTYSVLFNASK